MLMYLHKQVVEMAFKKPITAQSPLCTNSETKFMMEPHSDLGDRISVSKRTFEFMVVRNLMDFFLVLKLLTKKNMFKLFS